MSGEEWAASGRTENRGTEPAHGSRLTAHLILIGLPGAGKSTVGRRVARELARPFLDLDREIERLEGKPVAQVFADAGEAYFRAREREVTAALRARPSMVVAPGGGWALAPENRALLCPPGRIIYLRVDPTTAVRRMGLGVRRRPLLAGPDPVAALERLLRDRAAAYAAADAVVDTEGRTPRQVVDAVRSAAVILGLG